MVSGGGCVCRDSVAAFREEEGAPNCQVRLCGEGGCSPTRSSGSQRLSAAERLGHLENK